MRRRLTIGCALLLASAAAPPAAAQTVELTPFLGWAFGGTFKNVNVPDGSGVNRLDIANSLDYGLVVDFAIMPQLQIELLGQWQSSRLKTFDNVTGGDRSILDPLTVAYYHVGAVFHSARKEPGKPQGFVAITGGVSHFSTDDTESEARFSFGTALGGKWFFNQRFGARLQSRLMITYFPSYALSGIALRVERRPDEPFELDGEQLTARVYDVAHTMQGFTMASTLHVDEQGRPLRQDLMTPNGVMTTLIER